MKIVYYGLVVNHIAPCNGQCYIRMIDGSMLYDKKSMGLIVLVF